MHCGDSSLHCKVGYPTADLFCFPSKVATWLASNAGSPHFNAAEKEPTANHTVDLPRMGSLAHADNKTKEQELNPYELNSNAADMRFPTRTTSRGKGNQGTLPAL